MILDDFPESPLLIHMLSVPKEQLYHLSTLDVRSNFLGLHCLVSNPNTALTGQQVNLMFPSLLNTVREVIATVLVAGTEAQ